MKTRYRLIRRGVRNGAFYCVDTKTGKRTSLGIHDEGEARQIVESKNLAERQPFINLQIARAYLMAGDPACASRTWQVVMEEICKAKQGETQSRWLWAIRNKAFDGIRQQTVLGTTAEQFLRVLEIGTVSTNVFLRKIHNFALDMNWLPCPVIPKRRWPAVRYKAKRAITREEHERIIEREKNPELNAFYQLCWHLGGSQSDMATLKAEDIDWQAGTISFARKKTGTPVIIFLGEEVQCLLRTLPAFGHLFPRQAQLHEKHRAKLFNRRCQLLGIKGISLHSYRYAWAERAKVAGYPERFAQQALGHSSMAVHRAYARNAQVQLPSLEEYEKRAKPQNQFTVVQPEPAATVA
ncbi:MAG: tyrosine-type recombinase/integrase [Verrucomicrobiia bacterium]